MIKPKENVLRVDGCSCFEKNSYMSNSSAHFFIMRLIPGQELLTEIRSFVVQTSLKAGFIASVVGSLSQIALRYAGCSETFLCEGCFEVISISGTLDEKGEHLHLSVANQQGQMLGGHIMEGCIVRTTLELVIGKLPDVIFSREQCLISGYPELKISPLTDTK